ncbi:MAG: UDP-4-amino-4,6-dideoxy-N-acetyl-beta-L-altrosamine transaminase [Desulfobacteraceae bacterium]|nr:MAG: UDP-4-amino-4,6-dideoxy-N-acetyl-beta-L-altrosamine transaminase [Desulfobacteraceae bacterium]
MTDKLFLDSNLFIYAADKKSLYHDASVSFIKDHIRNGFFTADICLVEFYQVITDGRKTRNPLSPEQAVVFIQKLCDAPEIEVLETSLTDVFNEKVSQNHIITYQITKFDIYDLLIALCLKEHQVENIVTFNLKDFVKYPWLTAIDPRLRPVERKRNAASISFQNIPYGRQSIDEKDVAAVCSALRSDYLTTGPKIPEFEKAVADYKGAAHAVAVSSGTAALHCAMYAIGIGPGDEVIVPPMTFAATANCVVYQGGTPIFADVDPDALLIDPESVKQKITSRTKALIAVDYAGQPCDYDRLREICSANNLILVADACHSLGGQYKGRNMGTLADLTIFSFHPVKPITTGEGGMIVTHNPELAERMRIFRSHGITTDYRQREAQGSWFYEMTDLGFNYRITDFQCAMGLSQLKKLPRFLARRREIAAFYDEAFKDRPGIVPLTVNPDAKHAYHLYVVKVTAQPGRDELFRRMRDAGIGVNVHYVPVHFHPFYRERFGHEKGLCPVAEAAYGQILSLPVWPGMADDQAEHVLNTIQSVFVG